MSLICSATIIDPAHCVDIIGCCKIVTDTKGEALVRAIRFINFDDLTPEQKDELEKTLRENRRDLVEALREVDRSLERLARKPKRPPRKPAKK